MTPLLYGDFNPFPRDVVFAYGYESTLWLGWDARAKRFVELRYSD